MAFFVGRERELDTLQRALERAMSGDRRDRAGRCLLVRGRRRVGKSRLVEEFCARAGVPYLFFTASQQGANELKHFADEVRSSNLPGRHLFDGIALTDWDGALALLDAALPTDGPAVVVFDEFPYLTGGDSSVEATFQKQWDRLLSRRRLLLLLVGSDLAMMEALNTYGRPFHQRGTEMVVSALTPGETARIVGAPSAAEAFDAHLITGGLPLVCNDWPTGRSMWEFLEGALAEPTSPLIVSGERMLAAEFPAEVLSREVLRQIGSGERTFSNIARASGGLQATSTKRSLEVLMAKRVVAKEVPLSTKKSVEARYRVDDPYLRFWLRFIGPGLADIERGRSDRVVASIGREWQTWRGKAIEPVVREALRRLSPIDGLADADAVGGFWTRTNDPEIDIIGADRGPVATRLRYAGTIKWTERTPLDQADVDRLARDLASVPGATPGLPLVAVSLSGVSARVAASLGPEELLAAF